MDKIIENLSMIVAVDQNYGIGYKNDLLCRIKEDLLYFKEKTMGSHIIMGENTYRSLPPKLPGRKYVVLSDVTTSAPDDILLFDNIEDVKDFVRTLDKETFVIGGGMVYKQFLDYVRKMYITEIKFSFANVDTYYPYFDKYEWEREVGEDLTEDGYDYNHVVYTKKRRSE